jgi:hypothetical protein
MQKNNEKYERPRDSGGEEQSPSLPVNPGVKSALSIDDLHVELKVERIDS